MRCKASFLTTAASAVSGSPYCAFAALEGSQAFACQRRNFRCQRGPGGGRSPGNCGNRQGGSGSRNGNSQGCGQQGSRGYGNGRGCRAASLNDNAQGDLQGNLGNRGQGWRNGGQGPRGRSGGGRGYGQGGCFQGNQGTDLANCGQGWRNNGGQQGWRNNGGGLGRGGRWNNQRTSLQANQNSNADSTMLPDGGRREYSSKVAQRCSCQGNMNATGGTPGGLTANEHADIQFLFDNRGGIERQVKKLYDDNESNVVGVQAKTTSGNPDVVEALQRHVGDMKIHLDEGVRVRQRDPFFRAIFDNHHNMVFEPTCIENGVEAIHKGNTPCAAALAHGHSEVVTGFIENGRYEAQINHDIPDICQNKES